MPLDESIPHTPSPGQPSHLAGTPEHPPLLQVHDLQLQTHREHVFGPLDWHLEAGRLGVIAGQQGSGRTSVLLALGGRMRGVTGRVVIDDGHGTPFDGIEHPRELMRRTAVARIGDLADIERMLTVAECVDERSVTESLARKDGRQRFHTLKQELGVDIDDETLVEELSAPMRALVTAILACLRPADLVLYDDLDSSLTPAQLTWMAGQLQVLGDLGHTFVTTALNTSAMPDDAMILDMDAVSHRDEPELPPLRHDAGFLHSAFAAQNPDGIIGQDPGPAAPARRAEDTDVPAPERRPARLASDDTRIEPVPHHPAHMLAEDAGDPTEETK